MVSFVLGGLRSTRLGQQAQELSRNWKGAGARSLRGSLRQLRAFASDARPPTFTNLFHPQSTSSTAQHPLHPISSGTHTLPTQPTTCRVPASQPSDPRSTCMESWSRPLEGLLQHGEGSGGRGGGGSIDAWKSPTCSFRSCTSPRARRTSARTTGDSGCRSEQSL